jgi:hypothetical protein
MSQSLHSGRSHAALPTAVRHRGILQSLRRREPEGLARLVAEIEADYQFRLGYLVIAALIQSTETAIEVSAVGSVDDRDRAERLAENLTTTWRRTLPAALRAFSYGRAAFEKTYRFESGGRLATIAGLDPLPFEQTQMRLDPSGSFAGIELSAKGETFLLSPQRSWWLALDATPLEPHGRSRYLGAPLTVHRERKELQRQEQIWYSKFAVGHGVARAPEREDDDPVRSAGPESELGDDGRLLDPMDVLRDRCAEIESGGVLVLSSKTYGDGKYLYDYVESQGQRDGAPLENRRRQLDTAALRSLGIPERALTHDPSSGSYAMAEAHREVLFNTCEGILRCIVESYQKYVVDKAVAVNWPAASRPRLTLRHQPVGDESRRQARDLVEKLLGGTEVSPLVRDGVIDAKKLAEIARLPLGAGTASSTRSAERPERDAFSEK